MLAAWQSLAERRGQNMRTILAFFLVMWSALPAISATLSDAAKSGDIDLIRQLISDGGDVNEPDALATPLHWAAMNGHADAVALLLEQVE